METFFLSLLPVVAAEAGKKPGFPLGQFLVPVVIMIGIFYLLVMRPQKRFQQDRQAMLQGLKKHDQVVTRGGIIGTIADIRTERDEIVVEIAKNTRVRLRRAAVEGVIPRDGSESKGEREKSR